MTKTLREINASPEQRDSLTKKCLDNLVTRFGHDLVMVGLHGTTGKGVHLADSDTDLLLVIESITGGQIQRSRMLLLLHGRTNKESQELSHKFPPCVSISVKAMRKLLFTFHFILTCLQMAGYFMTAKDLSPHCSMK